LLSESTFVGHKSIQRENKAVEIEIFERNNGMCGKEKRKILQISSFRQVRFIFINNHHVDLCSGFWNLSRVIARTFGV
jgi:hypothetical protein